MARRRSSAPSTAHVVTANVGKLLRDIVTRELAEISAVDIAATTGCTLRQAEHWKAGDNAPHSKFLIILGRAYPKFGILVRDLLVPETPDPLLRLAIEKPELRPAAVRIMQARAPTHGDIAETLRQIEELLAARGPA
jgi:hypothetical protein